MPKKAHLIKASVLNEHSAETNEALIFVYAGLTREVDNNMEMAAFHCVKCATEFAAIKGTSPYCVTCGSESVEEDDAQNLDVETYEDADEELASITCHSCNTHNIVKLETASVLGSSMHCVTCGENIDFQSPDELEDEDLEIDELEEAAADSDADDLDADEIESDEDEMEEAAAESDEEELEEDDYDAAMEKLEKETARLKRKAEILAADEEESDDENLKDDFADAEESDDVEEAATDSDEEEKEYESDLDAEELEEDAAADSDEEELEEEEVEDVEEEALASLVGDGEFSLDRVNDVIVASINSLPVATLSKENAGENKAIFHSAEFSSAIKHTVKKYGVQKGLENFNFALAKVKIPVSNIVKNRVTASVEKETARVEKQLAAMTQDFEQCFGIAMAALNKGFFKNKTNPLKQGFVAQLTTAGLRNPAKLVDGVFKTSANDMTIAAFELAKELMTKSLQYRNEIAEAVGEANYQENESDTDENNVDDENLENRLEGAGLRRAESASVKTSQSAKPANFALTKTSESVEISNVLERVRSLSKTGNLFRNF